MWFYVAPPSSCPRFNSAFRVGFRCLLDRLTCHTPFCEALKKAGKQGQRTNPKYLSTSPTCRAVPLLTNVTDLNCKNETTPKVALMTLSSLNCETSAKKTTKLRGSHSSTPSNEYSLLLECWKNTPQTVKYRKKKHGI